MSPGALGLILVTVSLSAVSQLALKLSSSAHTETVEAAKLLPSIFQQLMNPLTIAALAGYGASFVLWLLTLRQVPLTHGYPFIMGLTVVLVAVLGVVVLGESLRLAQLVGMLLVCSGLVLIARG